LNSAAAQRFAQPSTILAGMDRAHGEVASPAQIVLPLEIFVWRGKSPGQPVRLPKTFRSLYVLIGTVVQRPRRFIIISLLLYFNISDSSHFRAAARWTEVRGDSTVRMPARHRGVLVLGSAWPPLMIAPAGPCGVPAERFGRR